MPEAKAKDTSASALKKKRSSQKFFKRSQKKKKKKKGLDRRSPQKNVFQRIFQALLKILTIKKIVFQAIFEAIYHFGHLPFSRTSGLEAKAKDFKICPRGLHLCSSSVANSGTGRLKPAIVVGSHSQSPWASPTKPPLHCDALMAPTPDRTLVWTRVFKGAWG